MDVDAPFGKLVGGALCLDFVNTVRGRVSNADRRGGRDDADRIVGERLASYDALLRWTVLAGVLTTGQAKLLAQEASERPADAEAALARALAVREAMYRVFRAAIHEWPPREDDLETLNRELRIARAHERLVASPRYGFEWNETRGALDRMVWPVVRSAAELLTSASLERVGQCPGDECGWLFLDTSRSRRRQWCDMGECGNVAKVRRFRQRRRARKEERRSPRRGRRNL